LAWLKILCFEIDPESEIVAYADIVQKQSLESLLIEDSACPFENGVDIEECLQMSDIDQLRISLNIVSIDIVFTLLKEWCIQRKLFKSIIFSLSIILMLFLFLVIFSVDCVKHSEGEVMSRVNAIAVYFVVAFEGGGNFTPAIVSRHF
jgi:hypothetical protein